MSLRGLECERRLRGIGRGGASIAVLALVVPSLPLAAAGERALAAGRPAGSRPPVVVYAERSGLRLGTGALTGRVTLVASKAGLRWRIIEVTTWAHAAGRTLSPSWDTTRLADGQYWLELEDRGRFSMQGLRIRNDTPASPLANASDPPPGTARNY